MGEGFRRWPEPVELTNVDGRALWILGDGLRHVSKKPPVYRGNFFVVTAFHAREVQPGRSYETDDLRWLTAMLKNAPPDFLNCPGEGLWTDRHSINLDLGQQGKALYRYIVRLGRVELEMVEARIRSWVATGAQGEPPVCRSVWIETEFEPQLFSEMGPAWRRESSSEPRWLRRSDA